MNLNTIATLSLTTPRLQIRQAQKMDLTEIFTIHSNHNVNRYIPYQTWQDMNDAHAWYNMICQRRAELDAEQFVLICQSNLIGTIITFDYNSSENSLEIGYVLAESAWGNGYMSEALNSFLPKLVATLKLDRLRATVSKHNRASIDLMKRLGFEQTGARIEANKEETLLFSRSYIPT